MLSINLLQRRIFWTSLQDDYEKNSVKNVMMHNNLFAAIKIILGIGITILSLYLATDLVYFFLIFNNK